MLYTGGRSLWSLNLGVLHGLLQLAHLDVACIAGLPLSDLAIWKSSETS